jgi:HlyD family secretion protein
MAAARTQTNRTWLWAGAALAIIAVFFVARYLLRERLPVRLAEVSRATLQNTVSTNGRVEPVMNYTFSSPIATIVKSVHVREGDVVAAGKVLITLDDVQARAQVAAAESGVKTAQASYYAVTHGGTQAEQQTAAAEVKQDELARDQAQHNVDALTRLAATGAAAPGEVTAAKEQLQTAEASLSAAQKNAQGRYGETDVARAQAALADAQAALAEAKHVEAQTSFSAPIAGTVYDLDATATTFAEGGKLLLQMADLHRVRVRAFFDEPDVGRLAVGQKVSVRWDAKPGREWQGHIDRLPSEIVPYNTRNVAEVLVSFDNSVEGLLPDTNVTVTVTISSESNALSMPREALHERNGEYFAFKVVGGELKRVSVKIGAPNLTQVPILSGLEDGDEVATGTTNGQPLQEGIPIKEEK